MQRPYLSFFIFAILFTLTIPFSFDNAAFIVPGWHTTRMTPYFLTSIIIACVLFCVTIAYWRLSKRVDKINTVFLLFHIVLTIPTVIFVRNPFLIRNINGSDLTLLNRQVTFATAFVATSYILFLIGQISFAIFYYKSIQFKKRST